MDEGNHAGDSGIFKWMKVHKSTITPKSKAQVQGAEKKNVRRVLFPMADSRDPPIKLIPDSEGFHKESSPLAVKSSKCCSNTAEDHKRCRSWKVASVLANLVVTI